MIIRFSVMEIQRLMEPVMALKNLISRNHIRTRRTFASFLSTRSARTKRWTSGVSRPLGSRAFFGSRFPCSSSTPSGCWSWWVARFRAFKRSESRPGWPSSNSYSSSLSSSFRLCSSPSTTSRKYYCSSILMDFYDLYGACGPWLHMLTFLISSLSFSILGPNTLSLGSPRTTGRIRIEIGSDCGFSMIARRVLDSCTAPRRSSSHSRLSWSGTGRSSLLSLSKQLSNQVT